MTLDSHGKLARDAELAVAELGLQAARSQTSPGGTKPNALVDHEELEPDGQKACHCVSARLSYLATDRPDIAFACKECSRAVGKATRADLTRLKRIGRCPLLHAPRAVWEFPLRLARWTTYFGNSVVDTESGVTEQCRVRILQHGTLCK